MNVRQVRWHPEADAEVEAAARWAPPRAKCRCCGKIRRRNQTGYGEIPRGFAALADGLSRDAKLPSFPFLISYRKSDHTIAVLAIVHGRRRPGYWMERA